MLGQTNMAGSWRREILVSDDITSLRVHVHGFVQGVGFRDFLVMSAQQHKLDGWVRNRSDGSVEALVSGPTKAVEGFVSHATRGPQGARITAVDLHNSEPPDEKGFIRRPSL
jgi:acylphosphatase